MKCWDCDEEIGPNTGRWFIKSEQHPHLISMSVILTDNEEFDLTVSEEPLDESNPTATITRVFGSIHCALNYLVRELSTLAHILSVRRKGNGNAY
jgi:hypothetical protein